MHWLTFFSQWLRSPLRTASMVPSGRQLAEAMAAALPADARQVIELGPGTGAITEALLDHQPAIPHMLLVEMNAVLVELLQNRYPDLPTVCADARQLDAVVAATPGFESGQVDAVVSSLGLLAMPEPLQHDILAAAFAALKPGGVFIQYTYGFAHPVADAVCSRLGLICISGRTAWLNLPPARVFIYRRV
ncbi:MAG TPA: methyltransferase domain-containing protein [Rhodanobacteraceae bacterium]|nr:methyltransferase domain-containing protein [Rhodanobacteraceae bacterium]